MGPFATPAVVLRCRSYGDTDVIVRLLTPAHGKIAAIAKAAKKSVKRFGGLLDTFTLLNVVALPGRKAGMHILQEAALTHPLPNIRKHFQATAYASYWVELVDSWTEAGQPQEDLYRLLVVVLKELDRGQVSEIDLSLRFQMQFLSLMGFHPNLSGCSHCEISLDLLREESLRVDIAKGGLLCDRCRTKGGRRQYALSKGTLKQLVWAAGNDMTKAGRGRFSSSARRQATEFLEAFVCYHLEKEPRSLNFIRQLRGAERTRMKPGA